MTTDDRYFAIYFLKDFPDSYGNNEDIKKARKLWDWIWKRARDPKFLSDSRPYVTITPYLSDNVTIDQKVKLEKEIFAKSSPSKTSIENPIEDDDGYNNEKTLSFFDLLKMENPYEELKRQMWDMDEYWDNETKDLNDFLNKEF